MSNIKKPPYSRKAFELMNSIIKPTDGTVSLVDTSPLASFEQYEEIYDFLVCTYAQGSNRYENLGTFFNAIFTQRTSSFMLSRGIMQKLVKSDPNYKRKTMGVEMYKRFFNDLLKGSKIIEIVEPQIGNQAGFYKLAEGPALNLLIEMVGREILDAKFESNYEYFKSTNGNAAEFERINEELKIRAKK